MLQFLAVYDAREAAAPVIDEQNVVVAEIRGE